MLRYVFFFFFHGGIFFSLFIVIVPSLSFLSKILISPKGTPCVGAVGFCWRVAIEWSIWDPSGGVPF